jgi:hypothetical protein
MEHRNHEQVSRILTQSHGAVNKERQGYKLDVNSSWGPALTEVTESPSMIMAALVNTF